MGRIQRSTNYRWVFLYALKLLRGEVATVQTSHLITEQGGLTASQIRQAMLDQGKRYTPSRASNLAQAMKASPLFKKVKDRERYDAIVWGAVPDDEIVARLRQHNGSVIGSRSIPAYLKREAGLM